MATMIDMRKIKINMKEKQKHIIIAIITYVVDIRF